MTESSDFERRIADVLRSRAETVEAAPGLDDATRARIVRAREARKVAALAGVAVAIFAVATLVILNRDSKHTTVATSGGTEVGCANDVPDFVLLPVFNTVGFTADGPAPNVRPTTAEIVRTTRGAALAAQSRPTDPSDYLHDVFVVQVTGQFAALTPGDMARSYAAVTWIFSIPLEYATDNDQHDVPIDLKGLGDVRQFSLAPECAPPIPPDATDAVGMSIQLNLESDRMVAGSTMEATIVVDNNTGAPRHVTACGLPFRVALVSYHYRPAVAFDQCAGDFVIPVGRSTYRTTLSASYLVCSMEPSSPLPCGDSGPPPLPPGDYGAVLFQQGDIGTSAMSVEVRVLKPADDEFPVAGVCAGPQDQPGPVVVVLNMDTPSPRCARVGPEDRLVITNNLDRPAHIEFGGHAVDVPVGSSADVGGAFGDYLAPGVHHVPVKDGYAFDLVLA